MPRPRSRPTNAYLEALIQERGYAHLKHAAESMGISEKTMTRLADFDINTQLPVSTYIDVARKFGVEPVDFITGLLNAITLDIAS